MLLNATLSGIVCKNTLNVVPFQTIKTFRTYNNIEAFVSQRPHQEKMVTYNPHLSRPAITTTTASAGKPKTAEPTPGRSPVATASRKITNISLKAKYWPPHLQ